MSLVIQIFSLCHYLQHGFAAHNMHVIWVTSSVSNPVCVAYNIYASTHDQTRFRSLCPIIYQRQHSCNTIINTFSEINFINMYKLLFSHFIFLVFGMILQLILPATKWKNIIAGAIYHILGIVRGRKSSQISWIWKHSRMFSFTF